MPDIKLYEAIYSAPSPRHLKPRCAPPSGGNAQSLAFVVVRDPDRRRRLGAI
jgi:nitroreductase